MTTISDKLTSIYNVKKDIKSAITEKGQSVGDNILDYAAAIRSIEQGSGGSPSYRNWWKVYFIDYDGTVLSYQEVNNGADFVFPDAPDHTDKELVFTGWNQTSNHTSDYDPQDLYTIVIGAIYDTVGNTKLMFNAHALTMTIGFTLTSTVANGITIDWGDGKTTTSSTISTEYTHTYDRSYLGKDVVVEIKCADGNTYSFDQVKTGLDIIEPTNVKFGKGCTSISDSAFFECHGLQSVSIPSSVTYIGGQAFFQCYSLQSLTIPSGVTYIGNSAFYNCVSLQSVSIPSSVTDISNQTFYNCGSMKSVSIPSSVTDISNQTFKECYPSIYNKYKLNAYNPNSIYNTFEVESNKGYGIFIKSVTIPSYVTNIEYYAFSDCYGMQSVTIPSSVTSISGGAFQNCISLQSVTIPSSVTNIDFSTFENCRSLQSLTIPSGVTNIGGNAFQNCRSLQSLTIPSGVTNIGGNAFDSCYSLQSLTIPSGVTNIDGGLFQYCYSLQSVIIPSNVTNIGVYTFYQCYCLQSITIPSGVTSIGSGAFYETKCILDFGNERTTVPTIESTDSIGYNFCIVPDALYDTWCAATNWSTMTDRIIKYSDYHK